jgi:GNAT superfamily N-acetyltransferase
MNPIVVRPVAAEDSLHLLTDLIHAAYAPHAARGLRYWGTHQTVEDTAKRFASGHGFIAEVHGQILGTITLRRPQPQSPVALYREPNTWTISQFAVVPSHQGQGVGLMLHDHALAFAVSHGARCIAIDTASTASALIAKYEAWGYEVCGQCDWRSHTNYLSVLMSRSLIIK